MTLIVQPAIPYLLVPIRWGSFNGHGGSPVPAAPMLVSAKLIGQMWQALTRFRLALFEREAGARLMAHEL